MHARGKVVLFVVVVFIVGFTTGAVPQGSEGPDAMLAYLHKACGFDEKEARCVEPHPIPFNETHNIIPMNRNLWTKEQIVADYKKNRLPGQVGPIVLLKTEFCYQHGGLCTVATSAFEKQASKYLKLYRVYGYWLYQDSHYDKDGLGKWNRKVEDGDESAFNSQVHDEYEFDQGPGANIIFLDPRNGETIYRTTASDTGLDFYSIEDTQGEVPLLDEALTQAFELITADSETPYVPLSFRLYTWLNSL